MARGNYTKEFKVEAVRVLNQGEHTASEIAMNLGVKRTLLYRWRDQLEALGESAFSGKPGPKPLEDRNEVAQLRRKLARVTEFR